MSEQPRFVPIPREDFSCIGFLRSTAKGIEACNADCKSLGVFDQKDSAVEAILAAIVAGMASTA